MASPLYKQYGFRKLSTGNYVDDSGTVWSARATRSYVMQQNRQNAVRRSPQRSSSFSWW